MGKGIKMSSALDALGHPHTIEALQTLSDHNRTIPSLVCDGGNCRAPVRFVPRGLVNRSGKEPFDRAAYIGLTAGRDSDHKPGCKYDALGQLKTIVAAESDPDFIGALNAGASELRLLLLHNNLGGKSLSGAQFTTSATDGSATQRQPKLYQPSGKKLASYLRTTADLLKLRERCEADDELAQHLVLRFGTKKIRWSDFFFEKNRYEDAWRMQQRLGSECHPFAVVGTVDRVYVPDEGSGRVMSYLNLTAKYERPDAENVTSVFKVSVGDKDSEWLQTLGKGTEVIVFGVWSSGSPEKRASGSKIYLNHTLTLYTKFKEQLVVVALLP